MYLVAGASGNALSVAHAWLTRTSQLTIGASGAISGVVAAALVVGWRVQGWRGPLTQAMARWLALILAFGLLANLGGGNIANAAHAGGAIAGAAIAAIWRRGYRYSSGATAAILAVCTGVVMACIAAVVVHDRTDPFATMSLQDRSEFAREALAEGRCRDAREGLLAVERLRARIAPVTSLRNQVQSACP
jgi:rhomboid protease GluP